MFIAIESQGVVFNQAHIECFVVRNREQDDLDKLAIDVYLASGRVIVLTGLGAVAFEAWMWDKCGAISLEEQIE